MSRKIRKIDPEKPDPDLLTEAAEVLNSEGLVVSPTETRYGLLALADKADTVDKVYKVKKRERTKPISVFVKNVESIGRIAEHNRLTSLLAKKFLPGPLTLIMKANENSPVQVSSDGKIGVRCSSSPIIAGIMENVDCCLTATSANISGDDQSDNITEISAALGDKVGLYLDGGRMDRSSSTVVDCTEGVYKILRVGSIGEDEIKKAMMEN